MTQSKDSKTVRHEKKSPHGRYLFSPFSVNPVESSLGMEPLDCQDNSIQSGIFKQNWSQVWHKNTLSSQLCLCTLSHTSWVWTLFSKWTKSHTNSSVAAWAPSTGLLGSSKTSSGVCRGRKWHFEQSNWIFAHSHTKKKRKKEDALDKIQTNSLL